jgi:hypothetical protein
VQFNALAVNFNFRTFSGLPCPLGLVLES